MDKALKEKITSLPDSYKQVFMLLPKGMEKPITSNEIQAILGYDVRHINQIISDWRIKYRVPIGGLRYQNQCGFYLATNEEEKEIGARSIDAQIKSMSKTASAIKQGDIGLIQEYSDLLNAYWRPHNIQLTLDFDQKEKERID
ncbi:hypothetical protein QP168_04855 [Aerococcus urinae]|uniref:Phage protein n=1 Tax=Aerococcus mictus TaxID=2976810 RepID=A0A1E9PLQ3_9LACT|nr:MULTISPECIES: hypothetical protein [Aerococcus]KAA9290415.1 hypothetical protein F6I06_08795 [Aerococcus mictus]MBU5610187.1 hypothetical protein [Aerococcus urinae]MCY3034903.1 hypothetical protein [Aerococcus mictus]MCY3063357.1 hypothetical protein [Aerococcus mictus]MCY3066031.1 hypothetical protein [Aerococcus mictus]